MTDPIALAISVLALAVSATTAWMTLLRSGTVKMTQPTVIFFGPDRPRRPGAQGSPKVYLRTLLFATSRRGRVIESMHVTLSRNEARQTFNVWVHGDEHLVRGSGLFIGETGVSANHHFLAPPQGTSFSFIEGDYVLEVFAKLVSDNRPKRLFSQNLIISRDLAALLQNSEAGLYFDWGADSGKYLPHVEAKDPEPDPESLLRALGALAPKDSAG